MLYTTKYCNLVYTTVHYNLVSTKIHYNLVSNKVHYNLMSTTVHYNLVPSGTPSGEGQNLTVYPLSRPYMDTVHYYLVQHIIL